MALEAHVQVARKDRRPLPRESRDLGFDVGSCPPTFGADLVWARAGLQLRGNARWAEFEAAIRRNTRQSLVGGGGRAGDLLVP
jgi:hypothetical protein